MKWIKTYQNYKKKESIQESKIFDFLKSKWSDVVQKFKDLKGQAYIKLISSFIPKELKESIFGEVKKLKTQNESLILEELLNKELFFSDEKIDNLSDKEYEEYIQKLSEISSKNPNFLPSNIEGDTDKSKSQIIEFLTQRGVKIDSEIKYNFKPSIEKINSNIDRLEISNTSKKILKVCSLILFFGLLMTKTEDALASGGDVVKDIDIPAEANFTQAQEESELKQAVKTEQSIIKNTYKIKVNDNKHEINKYIELDGKPISQSQLDGIIKSGELDGSKINGVFGEKFVRFINAEKGPKGTSIEGENYKIVVNKFTSNLYDNSKLGVLEKSKLISSDSPYKVTQVVTVKDGNNYISYSFTKVKI